MERHYATRTIEKGPRPRPLPLAARSITPSWSHAGRTWSVDTYMAANRVSGVLVIKDGKIVLERYAFGRKPEDRWLTFSIAKSVTSTLVGAALADGKIRSLTSPVTDYIPQLKGSAYEGVTVQQLLSMSSGVAWNEDYTDRNADVARAHLGPMEPGVSPIVTYMAKLPRKTAAGSSFLYSTGETDLAGVLLANAVGKPLSAYASEKLWKPAGMERDALWMVDRAGFERGGCCIAATLRDYGRFGLFVLEGGVVGGQAILPRGWMAEATSVQIRNGAPAPGYGYFWWLPPSGGYEAAGVFGQSITTFPKERVIVVTNAAWPSAGSDDLWAAQAAFVAAARKAALVD